MNRLSSRSLHALLGALVLLPLAPASAQTGSAAEASATKPGRLMNDVQTSGGSDDKGDRSRQRPASEEQGAGQGRQANKDPKMHGQGTSSGSTGSFLAMRVADQDLLKQWVEAHAAQVKAGNMALNKSQDAQVLGFARLIINEHSRGLKEAEQLARAKGVKVPQAPSGEARQMLQQLEKAQGPQFDRMFLDQAGKQSQQRMDKLLSQIDDKVKDVDFKTMASQWRGALKQQSQSAAALQAGRSESGAGAANKGEGAGKKP